MLIRKIASCLKFLNKKKVSHQPLKVSIQRTIYSYLRRTLTAYSTIQLQVEQMERDVFQSGAESIRLHHFQQKNPKIKISPFLVFKRDKRHS